MKTLVLVLLAMMIGSVVGCGDTDNNLMKPDSEAEAGLWGDKRAVTNTASGPGGRLLAVIKQEVNSDDNVPAAPTITGGEKGEELRIRAVVEVVNNGAKIKVTTPDGSLIHGDYLLIYAADYYLGYVTLIGHWESVIVTLTNDELPSGRIRVTVKVQRAGNIIDSDRTSRFTVERGPELVSAVATADDEISLTFNVRIDIDSRMLERNLRVYFDGDRLDIRRFFESRKTLVVEMEDDFKPGHYKVSYDGDGGLEDEDGHESGSFSVSFDIVYAGKPWKRIQVGLYDDSNHLIIALEHFGRLVSPWSKDILDRLRLQRRRGTVDVHFVSKEDLGLRGKITLGQLYRAMDDHDYESIEVKEVGALIALAHSGQPLGEHVLAVTDLLDGPDGEEEYLLGVVRTNWPKDGDRKRLIAHRLGHGNSSQIIEIYDLFAVAKR